MIGASTAARRSVVVRGDAAAALGVEPPNARALLDATRRWLDGATGTEAIRAVISIGDARYPRALLESPDPPLLLYAHGRLELLRGEAVAIVGSRNPTPQGAENARAFAAHLAGSGLTIVSGLALGIDAAAHEGALEAARAGSGGGSTIAVVGTGLDIVYPRSNLALARRIAAEGLVLSEYPIGTPSLPVHFPQRNRIIAGLARGTLVVEAALRSGSLITARLANEAGREVFAIPGSIHSPLARGCHALIRQGARLVEDGADILDELKLPVLRAARGERPTEAEEHGGEDLGRSRADGDAGGNGAPGARLLEALGHDPVTLDALAARTGRSAAELAAGLLALELEGRVARLPGQLFQRMARG